MNRLNSTDEALCAPDETKVNFGPWLRRERVKYGNSAGKDDLRSDRFVISHLTSKSLHCYTFNQIHMMLTHESQVFEQRI